MLYEVITAKPVGLVFVSVATTGGAEVRSAILGGGRAQVRRRAVDLALNLLLSYNFV